MKIEVIEETRKVAKAVTLSDHHIFESIGK